MIPRHRFADPVCGLVLCGLLALAACTPEAPPSAAEQADVAACTRQADAVYQNATIADLSRTSTNYQRFTGQATELFHQERLGDQHVRDDQIQNCVNNGAGHIPGLASAPLPAPQILTPGASQ